MSIATGQWRQFFIFFITLSFGMGLQAGPKDSSKKARSFEVKLDATLGGCFKLDCAKFVVDGEVLKQIYIKNGSLPAEFFAKSFALICKIEKGAAVSERDLDRIFLTASIMSAREIPGGEYLLSVLSAAGYNYRYGMSKK